MSKSLVIFEYKDEVEAFISQQGTESIKDQNVHILALQPCVQAYLKRRNIPYLNTIGFFNIKSHERLILKAAEIVKPFRDIVSIEDDLGVKEGYNNAFTFYLRHYSILYLLWMIEVIDNAIEQLKPEKLIAFKLDYAFDVMDTIPRNERHLGIIVEELAGQRGLKIELLTGWRRPPNPIMVKVKTSLFEMCKMVVFRINMVIISFKSGNKEYILYPNNTYNLNKIIESFLSKFSRLMSVVLICRNPKAIGRMICGYNHWCEFYDLPGYLPDNKRSGFVKELNKTVTKLKEHFSNNGQILRYKGVMFQKLVFLKIERSMIPFLITLHGQTYHLDKFIRNKRPALILSQMSRGLRYNLGELSEIHNIPSVLISHGSHVPTTNRFADMEWREHGLGLMDTHYKYLAIQTPWARSYLTHKLSNSIPIITGPLLFTKARRDEDYKLSIKKKLIPEHNDKIIIIHAGTPKAYQSLRPFVYETIDEYIENINSLIRAVDRFNEIHLIVRFRPSEFLQLNDFLDLLTTSDCYSVHSEGTFADYLIISDLLASYSSTTIEEALQNKVPVLLYDSQGKYCHIKDAQVLDPSLSINVDSCYFIDSEKKLDWGLNWLVVNHFTKDIPDNVWERHVFEDSDKVELTSYFNSLFSSSSGPQKNR